jgi:hypothetical protein
MSSLRTRTRTLLFAAVAALAVLVPLSSASAVELKGEWAPINRCPVDDPAMINSTGAETIAICAASESPSGSIKLGKLRATATGNSNLQFGIVGDNLGTGFTAINPPGGAIISDPVRVRGGLLNLTCGDGPDPIKIRQLCRDLLEDNVLNRVTAKVESAGPVTDFDLVAGLSENVPIVTLPVKIKLSNPVLGNNCYIGSNANPIVLHPANTDLSNMQVTFGSFDPITGLEDPAGVMGNIEVAGVTQGDSTFAVPKATKCGPLNILTGAINNKVGLPSPSGNNELVLNNATTNLIGINDPTPYVPTAGAQLAEWWHGAELP